MGLTKMDEYEIMNPSNYWWYWITGPYNVTFGIKTALESDKNVALFVPEDLPWRKPMRLNVKGTEDAHIEIIDLQDDADFKEALDDGRPARSVSLNEDQLQFCKINYHLLTLKPK